MTRRSRLCSSISHKMMFSGKGFYIHNYNICLANNLIAHSSNRFVCVFTKGSLALDGIWMAGGRLSISIRIRLISLHTSTTHVKKSTAFRTIVACKKVAKCVIASKMLSSFGWFFNLCNLVDRGLGHVAVVVANPSNNPSIYQSIDGWSSLLPPSPS